MILIHVPDNRIQPCNIYHVYITCIPVFIGWNHGGNVDQSSVSLYGTYVHVASHPTDGLCM